MRGNFVYKKLGERVIAERRRRKLSQEDLAHIADMDRTHLARLEKGKANPSIRTLHKIARKLRIKIGRLLKDI